MNADRIDQDQPKYEKYTTQLYRAALNGNRAAQRKIDLFIDLGVLSAEELRAQVQ